MENGLPMLHCLLQHTLRSLCSSSYNSSNPSKWVYAVFWRILPRNYPPPKWEHGGSLLDRAKGNKRNWILVWEDGFCDFCECERAGRKYLERRFGAEIFFKMAHEVYNFGEGLVGKIASDNGHKWVYRNSPKEIDPTFISSWNMSFDPQPRAWEAQFSSGIETIAVISVKDGAIQLGSFDKVGEDLNMVMTVQRKLSYIQSIHPIQRPYQPICQDLNFLDYNYAQGLIMQTGELDDYKYHSIGSKRQSYEIQSNGSPTKSLFLGYNSPNSGNTRSLPLWSIPPFLPSNFNIGAFSRETPLVQVPYCGSKGNGDTLQAENLRGSPSRYLKGEKCDASVDEISAVDVKEGILAGVPKEELRDEKPNNENRIASL